MMDAITSSATSPRRAALLVHALADADRDWLLAALPPAQRVTIEALLTELRELGFTPSDAATRNLIDEPVRPHALGELHRFERLSPAQIDALIALLRSEPPRLALALLTLHAWPWRGPVLRSLGLHEAAVTAQAAAPALCQAVGEVVLRRLESALPSVPHRPRVWHRLAALVRRAYAGRD